MQSGVEIYGDHGINQINSEMMNLAFVRKGSMTVGQDTWTSMSITGEMPILCIKSSRMISVNMIGEAPNFTFRFYWMSALPPKYSGSHSFTWYLFDIKKQGDIHGAGLELFGARFGLSFSSNYKPMKIVGATSCAPVPHAVTSQNNVTIDGQYRNAALFGPKTISLPYGDYAGFVSPIAAPVFLVSPEEWCFFNAVSTTSTSVIAGYVRPLNSSELSQVSSFGNGWVALAVDVSGL